MSQQNIQALLTRVPVLTLNLEGKYFSPKAPSKLTVGFGPLPVKIDLTECLSHRHLESPSRKLPYTQGDTSILASML